MSLRIRDSKRTKTTNSKNLFKILRYKSFSHSSPNQQISLLKRKPLSLVKKFHSSLCNWCNRWLNKMRMVENIWVSKMGTSSCFYKRRRINFLWRRATLPNKFLCICVNTELKLNSIGFNSSRNSKVVKLSSSDTPSLSQQHILF